MGIIQKGVWSWQIMCHFLKTCELQVRSIVFTYPKTIKKKIKIIKTLMGWGDGGWGRGWEWVTSCTYNFNLTVNFLLLWTSSLSCSPKGGGGSSMLIHFITGKSKKNVCCEKKWCLPSTYSRSPPPDGMCLKFYRL